LLYLHAEPPALAGQVLLAEDDTVAAQHAEQAPDQAEPLSPQCAQQQQVCLTFTTSAAPHKMDAKDLKASYMALPVVLCQMQRLQILR